ncbi:hypothetical protein JAAARDRAFT_61312 [Jaapia argillacea MUCL 33604]|uniref:Secreted protein n=1 Tax=Jaapia argillacea MUCL 33604 TaxID=933084 RepID=A0A067PFC6_9AGAM|nr:hypothetical protein JAAARDRAFT_61312 [Jaapia argillacea MUCL 33604]
MLLFLEAAMLVLLVFLPPVLWSRAQRWVGGFSGDGGTLFRKPAVPLHCIYLGCHEEWGDHLKALITTWVADVDWNHCPSKWRRRRSRFCSTLPSCYVAQTKHRTSTNRAS